MNTRRRVPRSVLFLMELLIMLTFFSVSSALCVRLFAEARILGDHNESVSRALLAAQSAAECFEATGGSLERMAEILGGDPTGEGTLLLRYDAHWKTDGPVRYTMTVRVDAGRSPAVAEITVTDVEREKTLCFLQTKKYIPEGG